MSERFKICGTKTVFEYREKEKQTLQTHGMVWFGLIGRIVHLARKTAEAAMTEGRNDSLLTSAPLSSWLETPVQGGHAGNSGKKRLALLL